MPPEAHTAAMKELKRLKKMPPMMPENAMIRCGNRHFPSQIGLKMSAFIGHVLILLGNQSLVVFHWV